MKYNPLTRRMFLQGAGSLLAIPLLPSLLPREAWGQALPSPRRFVSLLTSYDIGHHAVWLPNDGSQITNLPQPNRTFIEDGIPIKWQPLREFVPTNSSVLAPLYGSTLSPYVESMNILRSLDFADFRGHDCARALGGVTSESFERGSLPLIPTMDQVLNANKKFNPAGRPIVVAGESKVISAFWSHAAQGTTAIPASSIGDNIMAIYNSLFSNGASPEFGQSIKISPRADLLNRIMGDFTRVRNSRNISSTDKVILDNAFDKISDVQKGLTQIATAQCSHKNLTKTGSMRLAGTDALIGKTIADIIAAAIICDTNRVFTIGSTQAKPEYATDGVFEGQSFSHGITHLPFEKFGSKFNWEIMGARQAGVIQNIYAPLVKTLAGAIDPSNGQSYLYNSLVFATWESGQFHQNMSSPVILAGNAGGGIKSGNYIDYADRSSNIRGDGEAFSNVPGAPDFSNAWAGVSYNRLFVSILQGMGLSPADYENDTLNAQLYGRGDIGGVNTNLTSIGGFGYAYGFDLGIKNYSVDVSRRNIQRYNLNHFRKKLALL